MPYIFATSHRDLSDRTLENGGTIKIGSLYLLYDKMAEEPTLPKLPAVSWDFETETFNNTRKRARNRGEPSAPPNFTNSSDPAVFSSDDDPQLENYTQGRHRKKRYIGSWFQQNLASSDSTFGESVQPAPKANRTLERQFDSGVWMGSEPRPFRREKVRSSRRLPAKKVAIAHDRPCRTAAATIEKPRSSAEYECFRHDRDRCQRT